MSSLCLNCYQIVGKKLTSCKVCGGALHAECSSNSTCDACFGQSEREVATLDYVQPEVIRRSHIELYRSCPYAFYLKVKQGTLRHNNESEEEDEGSVYALLGRDLHVLFDVASNTPDYEKRSMLQAFNIVWDNYSPSIFDDEAMKEKLYKRAIDCIDKFYDILPTLPEVPFITEENIVFSIADDLPDVSITMDRIDEVHGELEMLDWKTGKVMVGKKLSVDLQAPLYIYAVQQKYGKPVRKFTFHYLSEGKERVFERVNDDEYVCRVLKNEYTVSLSETIRTIKKLFGRIKNREFNVPQDVKSMYYTCKVCEFKANGSCQGAEVQSWNNLNQGWG